MGLMVPIYWMFKTSLKTTMEAEGGLQWYPANPTIDNYAFIIRSPEWLRAFRHTIQYAALNVAIVVTSTNTKPFTVITSRKMYCMAWSPGP